MNGALLGWGLAVAAVAGGYMGYGWPGVALAATLLVFWLLLQFSRSVRALRDATGRPVGQVPNAVMLHARPAARHAAAGDPAPDPQPGRKTGCSARTYGWRDDADDLVRVELVNGRVTQWTLQRAAGVVPDADLSAAPAGRGAGAAAG